jgi:hypothetical protein
MAPHPLALQRCPAPYSATLPVRALSTVPLPIGYPAFRKAGDSICTRLSRKYSAVRATSPLHPDLLPRTSSHSGMTRSTFPSHNFCFTSSTQQSASSPNASLPKAHRCSPAGYPSTTRTRSGHYIWANPSLQVAPSPMTTAAPPVSPSPPPLQRHRGLHHRHPHAGLPPLNPLLSLPQPASPMLLRPLKQPLCRTSPLGPDCLFLCLPHRSPPTPILPPRQIWDTPASSSQPLPLASRAQLGQGESLSPSCRDRGRMLGFHPQSSRGGWAIGCSSRQA